MEIESFLLGENNNKKKEEKKRKIESQTSPFEAPNESLN